MAAVVGGDVQRREHAPVHHAARPPALPAAVARVTAAHGSGGAPAPAAPPRRAVRAHHRPCLDPALHGPRGVGEGVGAAAAGEVRRARGRDRDGVAVEQADAPARAQGLGRAAGAARLPAEQLRDDLRRARPRDRGGRGTGAHRPAGGAAGAHRRRVPRAPRSAGFVPARPRSPRITRPPASRRATTP